MSWTKLGDEFSDAAQDLSDAAFRTHVEALGWSNRKLLDLVIPKRHLKRFAETDDPDTAVKELIQSGWWQDLGDSWHVGVHFAHWQRDRVQVEHERELNAVDQRRSRRHKLGDHSLCLPSRKCRLSPPDSPPDIGPDSGGESEPMSGPDPGRAGTGTEQDGLDEEVVPKWSGEHDAAVDADPAAIVEGFFSGDAIYEAAKAARAARAHRRYENGCDQ